MILNPSPELIESKGGQYCGKYPWPMSGQDVATEGLWRTPEGMMRHHCQVDGFVHVFALPVKGLGTEGVMGMVEHLTYDSEPENTATRKAS